jgi:hypothetical protein
MWVFAPLLVIICGLIYLASALRAKGIYWAYKVCKGTWILCDHSEWVVIGAGLILISFIAFNKNTV